MTTSEQVRTFYDDFADRVLLRDLRSVNPRQRAVMQLCERFVPKGANILEVGCGIGVLSKFLRQRAQHILATDISPVNIQIAQRYAGAPNIRFEVVDILEDKLPPEKFDVVILADVIEHIPHESHADVFKVLENVLKPQGRIILTFPTHYYQDYLRATDPTKLQIVDENIDLRHLLSQTQLTPVYYSLVDMWGANQYIHLVLGNGISYINTGIQWSQIRWIRFRFENILWRLQNARFLRALESEFNR